MTRDEMLEKIMNEFGLESDISIAFYKYYNDTNVSDNMLYNIFKEYQKMVF